MIIRDPFTSITVWIPNLSADTPTSHDATGCKPKIIIINVLNIRARKWTGVSSCANPKERVSTFEAPRLAMN